MKRKKGICKIMGTFVQKYGEWIFRLVLLAGVCGNLWLTQNFVKRTEFEAQSKENTTAHLVIQTSVSDIATTMKLLAANLNKLDDHELRIRQLSEKVNTIEGRVLVLEHK